MLYSLLAEHLTSSRSHLEKGIINPVGRSRDRTMKDKNKPGWPGWKMGDTRRNADVIFAVGRMRQEFYRECAG